MRASATASIGASPTAVTRLVKMATAPSRSAEPSGAASTTGQLRDRLIEVRRADHRIHGIGILAGAVGIVGDRPDQCSGRSTEREVGDIDGLHRRQRLVEFAELCHRQAP